MQRLRIDPASNQSRPGDPPATATELALPNHEPDRASPLERDTRIPFADGQAVECPLPPDHHRLPQSVTLATYRLL